MSLVTLTHLRAMVTTGLDDTQLQTIIDREEAEVVRRYGAHYVDSVTTIVETYQPTGLMRNVFLRRGISSIASVTEQRSLSSQVTPVASTDYAAWYEQGRLERVNGTWGAVVNVTYVPQNDRDLRRQVIIELVRLALEQTAMRSESIAGEHSYTAPEWEQVRVQLYRRLGFRDL